ncbi:MAG: hypothetical protein AAFR84_19850 [Pseudomonadota bacterium]
MPVRFVATIACVFFFIITMMAISGALTWLVPQLPEIVQKMMGWFGPGFCAGYLFTRWRAVRLLRSNSQASVCQGVLHKL